MKIKPIKDLRDTNKISQECHQSDEPIFVTKNGYEDLVIMSQELFDKQKKNIKTNKNIKRIDINEKQSNPFGYVKVSASTVDIKVCDIKNNINVIKEEITKLNAKEVKIAVFQELGITGYTCGDLFFQQKLLNEVKNGIEDLAKFSKDYSMLFVVGAPIEKDNKLYNCAVVICKGEILAVIAKKNIPTYREYYEDRHFAPCPNENTTIEINGKTYPFGNKFVFVNKSYALLKVGVELCEDLWVNDPPSTMLAKAGANVILNLSASNEIVGKKEYRRNLVKMTSARLISAYIYASAGIGESTTDMVFGGHNLIAENGKILAESKLFTNSSVISEIDLELIKSERYLVSTYENDNEDIDYIYFSLPLEIPTLTRTYFTNPFIPSKNVDVERTNDIIMMQAMGLLSRLKAINCNTCILGFSGGLDSTLALLVILEAYKKGNFDTKNIKLVTMPSSGTSDRTFNNVLRMCKILNLNVEEINIAEAVKNHLKDIGHDQVTYDATYENAQARERTQILMDLANKYNGIVVGTGDLSELALGWCTYNGDQMSMYAVNVSIPKTLVRYLVQGYALEHEELKEVLFDILDTPISPELMPLKDGKIDQKTEDLIGPYELHDFFIYYFLRYHFEPSKILFIANYAFNGKYDKETIKKWLKVFIKRFFTSQFKRSAIPDGVKVGTISLSPRADLRMPSDASFKIFLDEN